MVLGPVLLHRRRLSSARDPARPRRRYLQEVAAGNVQAAPGAAGWIPPEVAAAVAQTMGQQASWSCRWAGAAACLLGLALQCPAAPPPSRKPAPSLCLPSCPTAPLQAPTHPPRLSAACPRSRCTLINAPGAIWCEACDTPKPKPIQQKQQQQKQEHQQQRQQEAPSSQWKAPVSAAAVLAKPPLQRSSSSSSLASSTSSQSAAAPPAPAPQAPPSAFDFPELPSSSGSRPQASGSRASSSSSAAAAAAAAEEPAAASSSGGSAAGGKGKKAGKSKGIKLVPGDPKSMQAFLNSGLVHPQNPWTQKAKSSGPSQQAGLGQWGASGGAKLAKAANAINDAWGR